MKCLALDLHAKTLPVTIAEWWRKPRKTRPVTWFRLFGKMPNSRSAMSVPASDTREKRKRLLLTHFSRLFYCVYGSCSTVYWFSIHNFSFVFPVPIGFASSAIPFGDVVLRWMALGLLRINVVARRVGTSVTDKDENVPHCVVYLFRQRSLTKLSNPN